MSDPRLLNGNRRLEALIEQTALNNYSLHGNIDHSSTVVEPEGTYVRDSQVKGRVLTSRGPLATGGFFVKQEIDGITTAYQTFEVLVVAADEFATLRSHTRRNLHEFLSSVHPESSYKE